MMEEVTVTMTREKLALYERAKAIGLSSIVVSMYGDRIQMLIDEEREACAKECLETEPFYGKMFADAIRARRTHD